MMRLRRLSGWSTAALLVAALAVLAPAQIAGAAEIPASYLSVADQDGANDVNAEQVDMTRFGRDDSDPNTYKLLWSWDSTDAWTGEGQTGDACALFDNDLDGNVNFAVCARVTNPDADPNSVVQLVGSPYAFTCADATNDRCSQPTGPLSVPAGAITSGAINLLTGTISPSPPANLITETDPFANLLPEDQDWPFDTTLAVNIAKSFLPANSVLVNVCSYPSAGNGGNNNPFDCIINPGDGLLVVTKAAPPGTTQVFDFEADPGDHLVAITGSGSSDTIGIPSGAGIASVTETVPAEWTLSGAACALEDGTATGAFAGSTVSGATIQPGKLTTCTFTNAPRLPDITVVKDNDANHDGTHSDTETVPAGATYPYTVTYRAIVTNAGTTAVTISSLTDDKVAGALRTAQAGLTDCADVIGTSLAAGASVTCYFDAAFGNADLGQVVNTVTTVAGNGNGSDTATDTSTVNFAQRPSIDLEKTAALLLGADGELQAGDVIRYTFEITNTGNVTLTGSDLDDALVGFDNATCGQTTLAPGASTSCQADYTVTQGDIDAGAVTNVADVCAEPPVGDDVCDEDGTTTPLTPEPGIVVEKDGPATAYHGDEVTYTFLVTNTGNVSLDDVTVDDDRCNPVVGPTEKLDGDDDTLLEVGETWAYTCTRTLPPHADGEENPVVNTVSASGTPPQGDPVSDTDTHSTRLLHPAIQIDKTGPAGATAGDRVEFTLTVTNPGDTAIPANSVSVTDSRCDAPPEEVARRRGDQTDATPNTLDPGDSWVYRCFVQTTSADASVTNVARVEGRDVNGRPVSDDDDHTVALQQVAPVAVVSGASRLAGPSRCTNRPFTARISGRRIQSVVWRIDGRVVARFSSQDGEGTNVRLRVSPRRYGRGLHRLTARVTYNPAAQTPQKTMRMTFRLCARKAQAPRFTG